MRDQVERLRILIAAKDSIIDAQRAHLSELKERNLRLESYVRELQERILELAYLRFQQSEDGEGDDD